MKYIVLVLSFTALMACSRQSASREDSPHELHDHAEENEQQTLFSDKLEFFMEYGEFESGHPGEILLHVTHLEDYSPCSCETISISAGEGAEANVSLVRKGIYSIDYQPSGPGTKHLDIIHEGETISESVHFHLHVHDGHHHHEHGAEDDHGHEHATAVLDEINFLKEEAWSGDFMVEEVRKGPFHTVIPTSGEIMPMPGEKKNIASSTRGMVSFADPHLVQGAHVEKGQLLFHISSEALVEDNIRQRRDLAANKLAQSRSEYLRHRRLYAEDALSEKHFLDSRSSYIQDSLDYLYLEKHLSEKGVKIIAPVSGSLHELTVSDGVYVSEGDILAILSPDLNLMLRADLPQQFFRLSQEIHSANFRTAYSKEVLSIEDVNGRLLAIGHSVKENNHYLPVNFVLENDGHLLEGAFAEVYLIAGGREDVLSVALSALGEEQGGKYVYVQQSGESYSKRRVKTGSSDGLRVEILEGLQAGERIVSRGVIRIKAASLDTGEIGHGHSH